jgi:uncharacterized protein YbjQ (UPF0145 family)
MMVTTTFSFEGYRIREYKGVVRGIIVRSPTIAQGFREHGARGPGTRRSFRGPASLS